MVLLLAVCLLAALAQTPAPAAFHFVILGDRTGDVQPGVWEAVWKQASAEKPAFFAGVGDSIEGGNDATAASEWREVKHILAPYTGFPLYLAPGNHDIWSAESEKLFEANTGHPPHYSFDYGAVHVTILDNSRSDELSDSELAFLESDLERHRSQALKFIVSHRPSWLLYAVGRNPQFRLHQLARKYGVQYVVAGHVHELLHTTLEGVEYISAPSSGGHLRGSKKYEDGWFFGYTRVDVRGSAATVEFEDLQGHKSNLADWGLTGLVRKP